MMTSSRPNGQITAQSVCVCVQTVCVPVYTGRLVNMRGPGFAIPPTLSSSRSLHTSLHMEHFSLHTEIHTEIHASGSSHAIVAIVVFLAEVISDISEEVVVVHLVRLAS